MMESVHQVAPTNITILITGESGTGKEIVARAIHQLSPRKDKPLFTVNCGAIPEGILESELFGHEKGAFTGAVDSRKGYFEMSEGGTLLLDEIGEMPLSTQVKLLRVLEERAFLRVGGTKSIEVDVRVLAATNRDLQTAVQRSEFRGDLFYRLNAIQIRVPPLRERKSDIPALARYFADRICHENKVSFGGFSEDAMALLENHSWPGNIRELRNLTERVIILEKGKEINREILAGHMFQNDDYGDRPLPVLLHKSPEQAERELIYRTLIEIRMIVEDLRNMLMDRRQDEIKNLPPLRSADISSIVHRSLSENGEDNPAPLTLKEIEKNEIEKALDWCKGNRRQAAEALGIGERTLYRKLKEYGLDTY